MMKIFVFLMAMFFVQNSFGQEEIPYDLNADNENPGLVAQLPEQFIQPDWDSARTRARLDIENFGRSLGENFTPEGTLVPGFVPIEARIGVMFMSALTSVIGALYIAIIPFLNALIVALLMFWFFMEVWVKMKSGDGGWLDFGKDVAIKLAKASFWLWVINNNPADIFMWMMAPLLAIGTIIADTILNSAANIIGTNLPDTCGAIHQWLAERDDLLISGSQAADLICLPTRPIWFLYTSVWAGFTWIISGLIQLNPLMIIMGLVFVVLFAYNILTFALRALGIIMDLFFILMFLPFTAMSQAVGTDTSYDGFGAEIWRAFAGFVSGSSLSQQIERFAKVVVYFILLSIVASLSIALLSTVNPFEFGNFFTILVVGCLVAYLLSKAVADKQLAGDDSFGQKLFDDAKGAAMGIAVKAKALWALAKKMRAGTP